MCTAPIRCWWRWRQSSELQAAAHHSQASLPRRKTCRTISDSATCTGSVHSRSQAASSGTQTGWSITALICRVASAIWITCTAGMRVIT
jgi:hypothetical protein